MRSGAARRSHLAPEAEARAGGQEELPHVQGAVAARAFKVRRGGSEKIPPVQGKEQRLRFAGVAMKRYPMSKERETQVRR